MDPNACMREIVCHFRHGETDDCVDACNGMLEWLGKGGFKPTNYGINGISADAFKMFLYVLMAVARS